MKIFSIHKTKKKHNITKICRPTQWKMSLIFFVLPYIHYLVCIIFLLCSSSIVEKDSIRGIFYIYFFFHSNIFLKNEQTIVLLYTKKTNTTIEKYLIWEQRELKIAWVPLWIDEKKKLHKYGEHFDFNKILSYTNTINSFLWNHSVYTLETMHAQNKKFKYTI